MSGPAGGAARQGVRRGGAPRVAHGAARMMPTVARAAAEELTRLEAPDEEQQQKQQQQQ